MQASKLESLRQAQRLIDQGRVSSAINIYQKVVDDDPSDLNAISMLGALYVKAGRSDDASKHFIRIADGYLRSGSAVSASYILKKVIRIDPANPTAHMKLGELSYHDGEKETAHNHFIDAGAAFWHKGNAEAAIKMNKRALDIQPDSRHAKVALALIEGEMKPEPMPEQKKKPVVFDLPEIIISIADGSDEVCAPMSSAKNQSRPQSPSPADPAGQSAPSASCTEDGIIEQIALAEYLVGCGREEQAVQTLRECLRSNPDNIQIREKLKDIYLRSEDIDRASEECVNIAGIYLARGEYNRAADYVSRARFLSSSETSDAYGPGSNTSVELESSTSSSADAVAGTSAGAETNSGWESEATSSATLTVM